MRQIKLLTNGKGHDTFMYKIIVDVGVGKLIEEWLLAQSFDVIAIGNINPEMPDVDIINLANTEEAVIITMDKDFGELVFKIHLPHRGILLLRLEDAVGEEKLAAIQNIFPRYSSQIKNNFCVYQNGTLRIRNH
jgi:predicted nuclease of predicted toxin-antitoxin system